MSIIQDFLHNRTQCVKIKDSVSDYIDIAVGSPQGTKLGPILWLFYVNDLQVDNFNTIKYADDTSFYKDIKYPSIESTAPAIIKTQQWSENNNMLLNANKTVVVNLTLNLRAKYEEPLRVSSELSIVPSDKVKFLGVLIDKHLTFRDHVDSLFSRCSSRI